MLRALLARLVIAIVALGLVLLPSACGSSDEDEPTAVSDATADTGASGEDESTAASDATAATDSSDEADAAPTPGVLTRAWSTDLDVGYGAVVSDETLYAWVGEDEDEVSVAALDLADGSERWTTTLSEDGEPGFNLAVTDVGVLVPYTDEDDEDHLVLLGEADGDVVWDIPTEVYGVWDQFGPGLAGYMEGEYGPTYFVDLDNGETLEVDAEEFPENWWTVDDTLAELDGTTLRIGANPFDPDAAVEEIELPVEPDDMIDAGEVLVLLDGDDVVGTVGSEERWRRTPSIDSIDEVVVVGTQYLAVIGWDTPPGGAEGDDERMVMIGPPAAEEIIRFDGTSAVVIGPVPDDFVFSNEGADGGRPFLVGTIDADPESSNDDMRVGVVLVVGDEGPEEVGRFEFTGFDEPFSVGSFVVVKNGTDVEARTLSELADAGPEPAIGGIDEQRIDDPGDLLLEAGDALVVIDTGAGVVSLYR